MRGSAAGGPGGILQQRKISFAQRPISFLKSALVSRRLRIFSGLLIVCHH